MIDLSPQMASIASSVRTHVMLVLVLVFWLPVFNVPTGLAQVSTAITPTTGDGNIGTTVTADGNTIHITGGTRPDNGANLFHSFDQFNVGRPDTAQFLNTTPSLHTSNILGRVTGGNPSAIFGTIDTMSYPGANLFLINPAGILFGPTASLNIGGTATFTSADYLRFADNARFTAIPGSTDALLSATPITAFGFLGSSPGAITVQGSDLSVAPGQTLALIGGHVTVENGTRESGAVQPAQLTSPGGRIHLASVASPGEVLAGTLNQASNINGQSFGALGTIKISQQSRIDASGEGGGTILIRGGSLVVIDDSRISANTKNVELGTGPQVDLFGTGIDIRVAQDVIIDNGAIIETNVGPSAHGHGSGGVRITADHIEISGGPKIISILETSPETPLPFAGIRSNVNRESTAARSGDISLDAASIRIKDAGQIETRTASVGNAGHIILKTSGNIDMDFASITSVAEISSGHAGNITFSSSQGNVSLTNSTFVSSQTSKNSSGNSGNITINAPHGDILLADFSGFSNAVRGTGVLGAIQITANNLHLLNESRIEGDNRSTQVAGNIAIMLDGRLKLSGNSTIETGSLVPTAAADLIIKTSDLLIADGSTLFTGARGRNSGAGGVISIQGLGGSSTSVTIDGPGSGIFSDTTSTGPGGAINLSARSLTIQNGGAISASTKGLTSSATGGSITVNTTDHVTMTDGASITASSTDPGNADAGNISIHAGQSLEMRDSSVKTESLQAGGGNIDIRAIDRVHLVNSTISTSVLASDGNSGNISIDPNVVALQNSQVLAQAVQGAGGNIVITTPLFLADSNSVVDASSQFGLNGTVTARSNLSESLGTLPSNPSQAHSLLTQRCAALVNNGQASSFVVAGREQVPTDPGGWLSSPLAFAALGENLDAGHAVAAAPTVMAIAAQDTGTVSLRRLTPAGFLIANFADSEATGCHS